MIYLFFKEKREKKEKKKEKRKEKEVIRLVFISNYKVLIKY